MTVKTKRQLTLEWHLKSSTPNQPVDILYRMLWRNLDPHKGYQLTGLGYKFLCNSGINVPNWSLDLPDLATVTSRDVLRLDRYMKTPYHLIVRNPCTIILFDQEEVFNFEMYGRDLRHFLESQQ